MNPKAEELAFRLLFREWLHRPIGVIYIQDRIQRRREGR